MNKQKAMDRAIHSEKDGCSKQKQVLSWINPSEIAGMLSNNVNCLILDIRPFSLYCGKHIRGAQSLSFSPILLRRLLKGSIKLDSLITDPDLLNAISTSKRVVLYDTSSTPVNTRPELLKLTETLVSRFGNLNIRILLGGIETFQATYPTLCSTEEPGKALSPSKITLDSSIVSKSSQMNDIPEGTPVEILPYLYLGSAKDSADLRILQKFQITSVLNITTSCPNYFESYLEYMSIPVEDSHQTDLLSKLQTAISFIDSVHSKGGRVFVHCHAGISRSATVCIAYLMQQQKLTVDEAYKFVQSKRPIISPNLGFMGQLMAFQKSLQKSWLTASSATKTTTTLTDACVPTMKLDSIEIYGSSSESKKSTTKTTRSISVPTDIRGSAKKSREGLKLSLNSDSLKNSTSQTSPCRVEAINPLTLSLNLHVSTTCT